MATARKQSLRAGMGRASARRCRARARWTRAGMAHACNENVRARKRLCRRRLCRRRCSRQFASMRAGVWIWANLVSPRRVMLHLLWKHVKHLAILSAKNRFHLAPCSLRPTGCARGERRSPALRDRRRCEYAHVAPSPLPKCRGSEQASMPTACCGQCMGRHGLCQIFGGIWAPPLGTLSEARYICNSLIVKPRRFKWCPEPADPRSGHCAVSHTRRSFHRASVFTTLTQWQ